MTWPKKGQWQRQWERQRQWQIQLQWHLIRSPAWVYLSSPAKDPTTPDQPSPLLTIASWKTIVKPQYVWTAFTWLFLQVTKLFEQCWSKSGTFSLSWATQCMWKAFTAIVHYLSNFFELQCMVKSGIWTQPPIKTIPNWPLSDHWPPMQKDKLVANEAPVETYFLACGTYDTRYCDIWTCHSLERFTT